jgi:hypothetical protein
LGKAGKVGVVAVIAAGVCAVAATAAVPVGTPDPKAIVLKAADFPGAKDDTHATIRGQGTLVTGYENVVLFGTPYGSSKYKAVDSTALVETDAQHAAAAYSRIAHALSSPAARTSLAKEFGAQKNFKFTETKPRALGVGDSSMELGLVVIVGKQTINLSIELVRVDRILVQNIAVGQSKTVAIEDAKALAGLAAGHIGALLAPSSAVVPTITGTAQVGQTLTAAPGTWNGSTATYAYQWQDCDATGTTCTSIANATGSTYVLQATDANQTVRVVVAATNAYGTATANSAVTAAIAS